MSISPYLLKWPYTKADKPILRRTHTYGKSISCLPTVRWLTFAWQQQQQRRGVVPEHETWLRHLTSFPSSDTHRLTELICAVMFRFIFFLFFYAPKAIWYRNIFDYNSIYDLHIWHRLRGWHGRKRELPISWKLVMTFFLFPEKKMF